MGDREVTDHPPQRREVGFVFQHYSAFKHMSVARQLLEPPAEGTNPAEVLRLARPGFEVRAELQPGEGEPLSAQPSRAERS